MEQTVKKVEILLQNPSFKNSQYSQVLDKHTKLGDNTDGCLHPVMPKQPTAK